MTIKGIRPRLTSGISGKPPLPLPLPHELRQLVSEKQVAPQSGLYLGPEQLIQPMAIPQGVHGFVHPASEKQVPGPLDWGIMPQFPPQHSVIFGPQPPNDRMENKKRKSINFI